MRRLGRSFIAGVLFLGTVVQGGAQGLCSFTQITNSTGSNVFSFIPAVSAAGNRIAFNSTADLVGSNGDGGYEIFLWDAFSGITQIANLNNPFGTILSINADGSRIVLMSDANPLGTNGDRNFEVFLWDASAGLSQITNTTGGSSSATLRINAAGNRIAFETTADITGNNGDGNSEIFLWDSSTGFTQITNSVGGHSFASSMNADGNRIAFESDANFLGSNGDGNLEIFLWDASTGLTQITNTTNGGSFFPSINAIGNRIAFQSISDLIGTNPEGNSEIFLWDASAGIIQITSTVSVSSSSASINAIGNRIAFQADSNLSDPGVEIFLWDASEGLIQVTNSKRSNLGPRINASGSRIAFASNADFSGSNGDGNNEVFLASCPLPLQSTAEVPAVSALGLGVLATLLGLAAAWTLRRRRGRLW